MALIGRLHPLLIHFPIALTLAAAASEGAALATADTRWRAVAVFNLRIAAAFALVAVFAGWRLALEPDMAAGALLQWHRWFGTIGALACAIAACVTPRIEGRLSRRTHVYRLSLFAAAVLIAAAGHLGGLLVWGPRFLLP